MFFLYLQSVSCLKMDMKSKIVNERRSNDGCNIITLNINREQ